MRILQEIASAQNRKDETLNLELAGTIVKRDDKAAVKELVENLNNKDKAIQHDCIKVLYEIGALKPGLIARYTEDFVALINGKNNRLQWGGMTALKCIATIEPDKIFSELPKIMAASDKGSVITRDNAVYILITLAKSPKYAESAFTLLNEQLLCSPINQFPMYAERALNIMNDNNKAAFVRILKERLPGIEKESKRRRIEKILKKLNGPDS